MKRLVAPFTLLLGAAGALGGLSSPASAADDVLDPAAATAPVKVGDGRAVSLEEALTQRLERVLEGAPTRSLDTFERTRAEFEESVLAVSGARASQVRVRFRRWEHATGERADAALRADTSLTGRTALLRPTERTWSLEPAAPPPTGVARAFLDRLVAGRLLMGADLAAVDSAVLPGRPARAGQTWEATSAFAPLLPGAPFTGFDAGRSELTATLERVSPQRRVVVAGALQLTSVPGGADRFTRGGRCVVTGSATWPAGRRPSDGSLELKQQVRGEAEGNLPEGTPYRTKVSFESALRLSVTRP